MIVSVDTLKNDRAYRFYLDNANWDIIVIDECQHVAERARGAQKSQRAKLTERLATRSETLILLSATPQDGKPESFASLMNMLDPTAIANPSADAKDDIKDLYIRRFNDHERFMQEVMTIEPAPYLTLVAVLHRDSS